MATQIEAIRDLLPRQFDNGDTFAIVDGYTAKLAVEWDTDTEAPWEHCDGHGPVSDWETRDKAPGELVLSSDRNSKRFYDFAEACKLALRDGWGSKNCREGMTAKEKAATAARDDFDFLYGWANDQWHYVGVCVTVYYGGVQVADDSLWGVEDCGDYWREVAAEMIVGAMDQDKRQRKAHAIAARRESKERNYWAARDVATV